jgi:hypothetical protein
MGARILRAILGLMTMTFWAAGSLNAQNPAGEILPDAVEILPDAVLPGAPSPVSPVSTRADPAAVGTKIKPEPPPLSASLSTRQKYALAFHRIVSPQMPMKALFVSGFELAAGTGPDLPTNGWGAFSRRVGYNALGISTTVFFDTAFVPALVHQDPRYFPLRHGTVKSRMMWAIRSEFVGVGDDGHAMPNYANLAGFALSSILANAYSPRSSVGLSNTVERYSIKIGASTGMNVAREFGLFDWAKQIVRHSKTAEQ